MPHFFFRIDNGNGVTEDEEGRELADLQAARDEAVRGIRSILSEEVKQGSIDVSGRIDIEGADRRPLLTVLFSEAVEIRSRPGRCGFNDDR